MSKLVNTLKSLNPFQKEKNAMTTKTTSLSILSAKALTELREDAKGRYAEILFVTSDKAILGLREDLSVAVSLEAVGPVRSVGARFYFDAEGSVVDIVSTSQAEPKAAPKATRPSSTGCNNGARTQSKSL